MKRYSVEIWAKWNRDSWTCWDDQDRKFRNDDLICDFELQSPEGWQKNPAVTSVIDRAREDDALAVKCIFSEWDFDLDEETNREIMELKLYVPA